MSSILNDAEEQISDLEDRMMEITQSEEQTERRMAKRKEHKRSMG